MLLLEALSSLNLYQHCWFAKGNSGLISCGPVFCGFNGAFRD